MTRSNICFFTWFLVWLFSGFVGGLLLTPLYFPEPTVNLEYFPQRESPRDPIDPFKKETLEEVERFLARDKTDLHEYIWGVYQCMDFALEVKRNAWVNEIGVYRVVTWFHNPPIGHIFGAVYLHDMKEVYYFEPGNDARLREPRSGELLCSYNGENCMTDQGLIESVDFLNWR